MDISFFLSKPKPKQKPKPDPERRSGLSKREQAEIRGYLRADSTERKAIVHAQTAKEQKAALIARRKWRRTYQAHYRAMAAMAVVII
jgi:hypothetical protein